jgi:hypothetical protein
MYVDPFWAGFVVGIAVTFAVLLTWAFYKGGRK